FPALAELRRLGFEAFALPSEGVPGRLEGLEPISAELGVELAPGGSLRVADVVDAAATRSPDGGAAAVEPALLVEEDGRPYTVRFGAVTALWGVEKPWAGTSPTPCARGRGPASAGWRRASWRPWPSRRRPSPRATA